MQNHTRWLSQLPEYFGSNLLDAAIRAVTTVHLGIAAHSESFMHESRKHYGRALLLLNTSLSRNDSGMASETLSATILLSFYEMFASESNGAWLRHAGGAGTLMKIRGPNRHLKGLDRDIYLAYRHTVYIDAFQRDEACFLAEPEWIELSHQVHEDLRSAGITPERVEIFDLAEEFYLENVKVPTTVRAARNMSVARAAMSPDIFQTYREGVLERVRQHRYALKSINLRFRAALQKKGLETTLHTTDDPVFPLQFAFVNVFVGSTHVGYWTIMIILNAILKEVEKESHPERTGLYIMENLEIAMDICRATPFMLTSSFLGPFFTIFALRLSLLVFEPGKERSWVLKKLFEIGRTHMKMAVDVPGFDTGTSVQRMEATSPEQMNWGKEQSKGVA
jgi:hypothetical protein